jgi:hypothetical protein
VNEARKEVREAARDVVVEILGALGVQPREMDSHFGEGATGTALELCLTRFAGAILRQAQPKPPIQSLAPGDRDRGPGETPVERHTVEVMSDNVDRFCDSVHEKLETLEGRMGSLKLNIGTSWHFLQEKLAEMRLKGVATKQAVAEARTNVKQWGEAREAEAKGMVDQWVETRETKRLSSRAQKAEDCAGSAIVIVQASIDDAERMILEAIAARRDVEAVVVACAERIDRPAEASVA